MPDEKSEGVFQLVEPPIYKQRYGQEDKHAAPIALQNSFTLKLLTEMTSKISVIAWFTSV